MGQADSKNSYGADAWVSNGSDAPNPFICYFADAIVNKTTLSFSTPLHVFKVDLGASFSDINRGLRDYRTEAGRRAGFSLVVGGTSHAPIPLDCPIIAALYRETTVALWNGVNMCVVRLKTEDAKIPLLAAPFDGEGGADVWIPITWEHFNDISTMSRGGNITRAQLVGCLLWVKQQQFAVCKILARYGTTHCKHGEFKTLDAYYAAVDKCLADPDNQDNISCILNHCMELAMTAKNEWTKGRSINNSLLAEMI